MNKIENLNSEVRKQFKKIYKFIYNISPIDWDEVEISDDDFNFLLRMSEAKLNGKDITFDIGFKYFRDNKIFLEKGVFVPQFDTEEIIQLVLNQEIKKGKILEVGSGSGAIAIALSRETNFEVTSVDINPKATSLSKRNAKENNANVNFIEQDIFNYEPDEKFDILISNPPYIKVGDEHVEDWVKENQPFEALYAENDGYAFYQHLLINNKRYLKENGILIFEIGFSQAKAIKLIAENSNAKNIEIVKDLDNINDRFVIVYM